jgi:cation diffusion facilitator CzcD-associated flavoprotein CzcO
MDMSTVKKVGVIGAGVAGLTASRTLLDQGIECMIFERNDIVGGVWAGGYYGFGAQVQKELYEYPEWPLPPGARHFTPGPEIQRYLTDYADHFGITPHIHFNSTVTGVNENPLQEGGWTLRYEDETGSHENHFDLIVCSIGLYSNVPNMPSFPDQDKFAGEIIHNSAFKSPDQLRNKKVVVLGFGKSATDVAYESAQVASTTTIVFRRPHWPVPRNLAGILPFKWGMLHRFTSAMIPLYYKPGKVERILHKFGFPLVWLFWRLVELLLRFQFRLGSCFGSRESLIPSEALERGAFSEAIMVPRPEFFRWIRSGKIKAEHSEISGFKPESVTLRNGEELQADIVVLGTGWKTDHGFLSESIRSKLNFEDDGLYLYRQMLHPDVPGLIFIGHASSVCSMLTYSLQSRWLGELIAGRHHLPSCEVMLQNIEEIKLWKRKTMPFSDARSARLILHMLHYHDEILRDFGANPRLKSGPLAPLKEVFDPYEPNDYRAIAIGNWSR